MPIPPPKDHTTYREWLYLEPEGEVSKSERAELERHLLDCRVCRSERRRVAALDELLAKSRAPVDPEFSARVVANLPAAGWEARNPRTWRWGALALAVFAGAALLIAWSAGSVPSGGAFDTALAAASAVGQLFTSAALAGAGLLAASWQGLGLALGELLGGSKLTVAVFGIFVVGVDVLFVRFLLRPARGLRTASENERHTGHSK
ncbi:MAG: zf-HC2 domain-containing protein [Acidobacteriota bacterium]|nr:zf-HC2 domain-containing protein [Acidobacteriota bacterium]